MESAGAVDACLERLVRVPRCGRRTHWLPEHDRPDHLEDAVAEQQVLAHGDGIAQQAVERGLGGGRVRELSPAIERRGEEIASLRRSLPEPWAVNPLGVVEPSLSGIW